MTPVYAQLDKKVRKGSYAATHRPQIAIDVVNECLVVQPSRVLQLAFAVKRLHVNMWTAQGAYMLSYNPQYMHCSPWR